MYKVIYHIDEREKWSLTLGNVTNMIVYYQVHHIDYQIEVLANSVAVCDYLKGSTFQSQILSLIEKGVIFVACHNAMEAHHILAEQLMKNILYPIPSIHMDSRSLQNAHDAAMPPI